MNERKETWRSAAAALLLLVPAPSAGVFFAMMYEPTRGTLIGQGAYLFSKIWILAMPILWLMFVDRQPLSLSPVRRGGLLIGATLGAVIAAAIIAAYLLFGRELIDAQQMRDAAQRNGIGTLWAYVGLVIYLTFVNSLLEEYVWRWFVFRKCEVVAGGGLGGGGGGVVSVDVHASSRAGAGGPNKLVDDAGGKRGDFCGGVRVVVVLSAISFNLAGLCQPLGCGRRGVFGGLVDSF